MKKIILFIICISSVLAFSCKRYKDKKGPDDPRLERPYCNDPLAVNYNWDFPGTPDSTVCAFPADMLEGHYLLMDSIYNGENTLDTDNIQQVSFRIYALSKNRVGMVGFCNALDTLYFTTDRYYRATADTTFSGGQYFCGASDTMTGYFQRPMPDSLARQLYIDFTVTGETAGFRYHRGTAFKQ